MPPLKLTPQLVRSLRPAKRTEFRDSVCRGLALMVQPSGRRAFVCCYSIGRRNYRLLLGEPSDQYTLSQAREDARTTLARVQQGAHPAAERRRAKRQAVLTVGGLVAQMLEAVRMRPSTAREWGRLAAVELAPLGRLGAADLARGDVRVWLGRIAARAPSTARHALEVLRRAYSWGLEMELLGASPCAGIRAPRLEPSERVLSTQEVRALWRALDVLGEDAYPDAVRLLLLTGVRRAMVLGARAEEFEGVGESAGFIPPNYSDHAQRIEGVRDGQDTNVTGRVPPPGEIRRGLEASASAPNARRDGLRGSLAGSGLGHDPRLTEARWTIPGGFTGRSKSGRPHVVPLSTQALVVVRRRMSAAPGEYLFPSLRPRRQGGPVGAMTLTSSWVRLLKAAVRWTLWSLQAGEDELGPALAPMAPWKLHSLRHTIATHMREDLRVERNVVALILGHSQLGGGGATHVYDRAEMLAERRAALVAWGSWVEAVAAGGPAKVLPMRG